MSTGGFIGVYVAKVMIRLSAEQGIKEGKHTVLSFPSCKAEHKHIYLVSDKNSSITNLFFFQLRNRKLVDH